MSIAVRYFINATFDASLTAPVCGYSSVHGFGADTTGGSTNLWLHNVLSDQSDDSYLFLGGGYHTTAGDHSSPVRARSAFILRYDLNPVYEGTVGTNETVPTTVTIPALAHTWLITFRWRAVGGTPAGRQDSDPAFEIPITFLGGTSTTLTKTWAESSPVFRTDTVSIRNAGNVGIPSSQLGYVSPTYASEALRDTTADATHGPNYLPMQLAWITVTGPNQATAIPTGRPGYRRAHFS